MRRQRLEISFLMARPSMMCSSCTEAIKGALIPFLHDTKKLPTSKVKTFLRPRLVRINVELDAPEITEPTLPLLGESKISPIDQLAKDLQDEIEGIGRELDTSKDTVQKKFSRQIIDLDAPPETDVEDELEEMESSHSQPIQSSSCWWVLPIFSIASGAVLMVAEHSSWFASNSTLKLGFDIGFGVFATAMTYLVGKDHFTQTFYSIKSCSMAPMEYLISSGSFVALAYSFLIIANPIFLKGAHTHKAFDVPLVVLGFLNFSHGLRNRIQARIESHIDRVNRAKDRLPRWAWVVKTPDEEKSVAESNQNGEVAVTATRKLARWVEVGSIIEVKAGQKVTIDGQLIGRESVMVRQTHITGDPGEVEKKPDDPNDPIYAGSTVTQACQIKTICEADNSLINRALEEDYSKGPSLLEQAIRRLFFPMVVLTAGLSAAGWAFFWAPRGEQVSYSLEVAMSILYSACPCSYALTKVLANVYKSLALQHLGVLVLNEEKALRLSKVKHFLFDKTGTLAPDRLTFSHIIVRDGDNTDKNEYLSRAAAIELAIAKTERNSVAKAIIKEATRLDVAHLNCPDFKTNPMTEDRGGSGTVNGEQIILGDTKLLEHFSIAPIDPYWTTQAEEQIDSGNTPIYLVRDGNICALVVLKPDPTQREVFRKGAVQLLAELDGVEIITGSELKSVNRLMSRLSSQITGKIFINAKKVGPEKQQRVREVQKDGSLAAFMGDEKNDELAIQEATVSIAPHPASRTSSFASIVLNGDLSDLLRLKKLTHLYWPCFYAANFFSFGLNLITVAAAAGAFYRFNNHQLLDPIVMGISMGSSSLFVMLIIAGFGYFGGRLLQKPAVTLSSASDHLLAGHQLGDSSSSLGSLNATEEEARATAQNLLREVRVVSW